MLNPTKRNIIYRQDNHVKYSLYDDSIYVFFSYLKVINVDQSKGSTPGFGPENAGKKVFGNLHEGMKGSADSGRYANYAAWFGTFAVDQGYSLLQLSRCDTLITLYRRHFNVSSMYGKVPALDKIP